MNIKILCAIPALLWSGIGFSASLTLPSIFADSMVLQQQTDFRIWGKASPNTKVKVSASFIKGYKSTIVAADSVWSLTIPTPAASFMEHSIKISVKEEVKIFNHVLIGEVWLASGQSNMQFRVAAADGSLGAIANSNNPYIRFFSQKHVSSLTELYDCAGVWQQACEQTTGSFSAVAYFGALQLYNCLNVPIGVIHSSWAGSTIEAWINPEGVGKAAPELIIPQTDEENKPQNRKPCGLYRGMIHPISGYNIRGVWWYQGESGRKTPDLYRRLFPQLCKCWRNDWQNEDLPFYTAEIPPYEYPDTIYNCGYIREVQLEMSKQLQNVWLIPMLDMGDSLNLHPTRKREVGERLAYYTLHNTYGYNGLDTDVPCYHNMTISGDSCFITFDRHIGSIAELKQPVTGFEVAGEDKVFYPATAIKTKSCLIVRSAYVQHPIAVRYCFKDYALPSLFCTNGMPVYPFRTDKW